MMKTPQRSLWILGLIGAVTAAASAHAFELTSGDSVVFLGDTLTEVTDYPDLVESFIRARYPDLDLRFFTSSWRDETATQALGRLKRDVLSLEPKPTVAVINYGMYDGAFQPFDQARLDQFTRSLEAIVTQLKQAGCRVWVVTPMSVDEDRDRSNRLSQANYNEVLSRFADAAHTVAEKHEAHLLDLYKITIQGRISEREHNRRFAYTRNGYTPDFIAGALLAAELLKAWKAEPVTADITLDWETREASITAGKVDVEATSDTELALKLTGVPLLWPYLPRTRTAPMHWPLAELSHMILKVNNCPGSGVLLGTGAENERALPMLKIQLDEGLDLGRFEPIRSLEPISLLARLVRQKNQIRTRQLWRDLLLKPVTQPELQEAYKANIRTLELYVLGYREWIRNLPKTFDVTLQLSAIVPENVPASGGTGN